MSCSILPREDAEAGGGVGGGSSEDFSEPTWNLTLLLRMADKMNRQLTCDIDIEEDTADCLVDELVYYGFVSKSDRDKIAQFLDQSFQRLKHQQQQMPSSPSSSFAAIASSDRLQAAVDVDGWMEDGESTPVRDRSEEADDVDADLEVQSAVGGESTLAVVAASTEAAVAVYEEDVASLADAPLPNGDSYSAIEHVATE